MWLNIKNLNMNNSERIIFENGSFKTDDKHIIIYGQNGIGKSTLLNGLYKYKPYTGSIKLFDTEVSSMSKVEITKLVSYVMQEAYLFDTLTVEQNLKMLNINQQSFLKYFKQFVLKDISGKKLNQLSGGEKQVVSLCIGLAKESKLLLLDEPFNNLSVANKRILIDILSLDVRKIIIISHERIFDLDAKIVLIEGRGFNA